ncbi:MAG: hypothetical protein ACK4MV_13560 [Beijerinckiaceae bacterium]
MADVPETRVTLTDFDVPFDRLVFFFVKAALAAIPAAIIVMFILMFIGFLLRAIFGVGHWGMGYRL